MDPRTQSRKKLLNDGYSFIRLTEDGGSMSNEPKIKICEDFGVWRTYGIYPTKAARDRAAIDLIKNHKCLCID